MNNTFKFLLGLLLLCGSFAACNSKKEQTPDDKGQDWYIDPRESSSMQRTMTDTLAVLYQTKKYLNFLKANEIDSAMNMLYEYNGDDVVPISEEAKTQVLRTVKMFPIRDYEIDRINMFSETTTEVHYTIQYGASDAEQLGKLQCVLMPVRVGYYWYITVPNVNRQINPEIPIE